MGGRERGEDEGFADAVEMPAAPVAEHTQHVSSEGDENVEDANAVKEPEKTVGR